MTISMDAAKIFVKIHPCMIKKKTLNKENMERMYLNIRAIYDKPIANIIFNRNLFL